MAELQSQFTQSNKKTRKVKSTPRVDLTPMVDLGFLLITFFIFTTTMAKPNTMELNMPSPGINSKVPASFALTLIPTASHSVAFYEGLLDTTMALPRISLQEDGLRLRLLEMASQMKFEKQLPSAAENPLMIMIKPAPDCTYKDVVNILDEMQIIDVKTYTLAQLSEAEEIALKK